MSKSPGKTTAPAAPRTADNESIPPTIALAIAWSSSQPERVGEVAPLPFGERLLLGRQEVQTEDFVGFDRQLPGQALAAGARGKPLAGDAISREQLGLRSLGAKLQLEKIGRCPTFVNGVEIDSTATLVPGDTVLLQGELLLVAVLRPRILPGPSDAGALHPFGEADDDRIVGESPGAWSVRVQLAKSGPTRDHVLIRGESGSGKELAAKAIHRRSKRAKGPLISSNAAALPPTLIASELFGNTANYPNAGQPARKGLVCAADRGTLFLDEIGELSEDDQAKLLRVLDEGEYLPLGADTPRRADIRLVGATNQDESRFRADFFARFDAHMRLPPLRERREDIPLLIRHLLLERAREYADVGEWLLTKTADGRVEPKISARLVDYLVRHPLPANVRQLRTILIDAINTSPHDKLTLPAEVMSAPPAAPDPASPGAPSKQDVEASLQRAGWNVARAARTLDLSRGALYRLMEAYGIERIERD
jgi:two-component system nitrogen regulation response regulator GlnG/two-component system response regulator HydG